MMRHGFLGVRVKRRCPHPRPLSRGERGEEIVAGFGAYRRRRLSDAIITTSSSARRGRRRRARGDPQEAVAEVAGDFAVAGVGTPFLAIEHEFVLMPPCLQLE